MTYEPDSEDFNSYVDKSDYTNSSGEKSNEIAKNGHFCAQDEALKKNLSGQDVSDEPMDGAGYKLPNPFRIVRQHKRSKSRISEKPASVENEERDQNERPKRYIKKKITGFDDNAVSIRSKTFQRLT